MSEETPLTVKLDYIQRDINEIKQKLDDSYVTQDQFDPIKRVVYGLVSLVLVSVVGAIMVFILR